MMMLASILAWFGAGVAWGWALCQHRDAAHVCRTTLHVHHCRFIDCEPDALVTWNEETGLSEITGYVVVPQSVWDDRFSAMERGT